MPRGEPTPVMTAVRWMAVGGSSSLVVSVCAARTSAEDSDHHELRRRPPHSSSQGSGSGEMIQYGSNRATTLRADGLTNPGVEPAEKQRMVEADSTETTGVFRVHS